MASFEAEVLRTILMYLFGVQELSQWKNACKLISGRRSLADAKPCLTFISFSNVRCINVPCFIQQMDGHFLWTMDHKILKT